MNKIEFWLMNNPIRALSQRYEAKRMKVMTGFRGGDVLEIGCGQGTGTLLIDRLFSPKKITAMDLDEKMIRRAKRRVHLKHVQFQKGDATNLDFKNNQFDAVFDFGILHHIPNWKVALKEVHRVLKPKGQFILEDLSIESFRLPVIGWLLRVLLDHPYGEMYLREEFFEFVGKNGFKVIAQKENPFWFNMVLEKK
jgi:ubiquinone/menaquinone biosynthesis C-methylase UbiE